MLFNEPKLLKFIRSAKGTGKTQVSVLFNEPKLLKFIRSGARLEVREVSVLFNEPKLLKLPPAGRICDLPVRFSALQRAEIAEMVRAVWLTVARDDCFSALQRAEIAEI